MTGHLLFVRGEGVRVSFSASSPIGIIPLGGEVSLMRHKVLTLLTAIATSMSISASLVPAGPEDHVEPSTSNLGEANFVKISMEADHVDEFAGTALDGASSLEVRLTGEIDSSNLGARRPPFALFAGSFDAIGKCSVDADDMNIGLVGIGSRATLGASDAGGAFAYGYLVGALCNAAAFTVSPDTGAVTYFDTELVQMMHGGAFRAFPLRHAGGLREPLENAIGTVGEVLLEAPGHNAQPLGATVVAGAGGSFTLRVGQVTDYGAPGDSEGDGAAVGVAYGALAVVQVDEASTGNIQGVVQDAYALRAAVVDPGDNVMGEALSVYGSGGDIRVEHPAWTTYMAGAGVGHSNWSFTAGDAIENHHPYWSTASSNINSVVVIPLLFQPGSMIEQVNFTWKATGTGNLNAKVVSFAVSATGGSASDTFVVEAQSPTYSGRTTPYTEVFAMPSGGVLVEPGVGYSLVIYPNGGSGTKFLYGISIKSARRHY